MACQIAEKRLFMILTTLKVCRLKLAKRKLKKKSASRFNVRLFVCSECLQYVNSEVIKILAFSLHSGNHPKHGSSVGTSLNIEL